MSDSYTQFCKQLQNGIPFTLNMADSHHCAFYSSQLARHGITQDSHPQFLSKAAVKQLKTNDSPNPVDIISKLDTVNGQSYSASLLSSIPSGVKSCMLTIELQDADRNSLGKNSKQIDGGGKDVLLSVEGEFSSPMPKTGRQIITLATCHYISEQGTHINVIRLATFSHPTKIELDTPRDKDNSEQINIGTAGENTAQHCDYTSKLATNQVGLPLKGEVTYNSDIVCNKNGKPSNATCNLKLFNTKGGEAMHPISGFDFFNHANTQVNGNTLSWDLNWLDFDRVLFNTSTDVYLVMNISVEVAGTKPEEVIAIISNTPDINPKEYWNTLKIPPICMKATPFPPNAATMNNHGYMQANSINAYNFNQGPFTVEAWIDASTSGTIISRKSTPGGSTEYSGFLLVLKSDGALKLATDNGFGFYEINTKATNIIGSGAHHVAGVRAPDGQLHIYLDGQLLPSTPRSSLGTPLEINTYLPMVIGATDQQQEPFNHFTGHISLVRVWQVQRSIDQLADFASTIVPADSDGLVAQWPLLGNGQDDSSAANKMQIVGDAKFG